MRFLSNSYLVSLQNLWDTIKAVLRGKFIAIQAYLKKQEKKSNKSPNSTPKTTRKERNGEPQRRKEILKIRAEINAKETKETIEKNQQSQKLVL